MKDCKGVTLVELIIVVTIIGILLVAFGFQFMGWRKSYQMESEVKQIYADLMNARLQAMQTNKCVFVLFNTGTTPNNYQAFDDKNGNCTYEAGTDTPSKGYATPKQLTYPITVNPAGAFTMDMRGLIMQGLVPIDPNTPVTMQVQNTDADVSADYDCINLTQTRINMGKWNGASCNEK